MVARTPALGAGQMPAAMLTGFLSDGWKVDFTSGEMPSGVTFSRASSAGYFNASGVWTVAGTNVPRLDYDLASHAPRGLLIEGTQTNLLLQNRDLTQSVWTKNNVTAAKTQTGIDSVSGSASSLTATTANATVLQAVTSASATRSTSAYVKRISGNGAVSMTQDGGTTWTAVTVTGSWTRVNIPSATVTNPGVGFKLATSGDAIAVDGVQCENAAYASSVIFTTTAAGTRSADFLKITDMSWFNPAQGTFVVEVGFGRSTERSNTGAVAIFSDGSTNNRMQAFVYSGTAGNIGYRCVVGGTSGNPADHTSGFTLSAVNRLGISYAAGSGNMAAAVNGGAVHAGTLNSLWGGGVIASLCLGTQDAAIGPNSELDGYIRRFAYWPCKVANEQLQALTA